MELRPFWASQSKPWACTCSAWCTLGFVRASAVSKCWMLRWHLPREYQVSPTHVWLAKPPETFFFFHFKIKWVRNKFHNGSFSFAVQHPAHTDALFSLAKKRKMLPIVVWLLFTRCKKCWRGQTSALSASDGGAAGHRTHKSRCDRQETVVSLFQSFSWESLPQVPGSLSAWCDRPTTKGGFPGTQLFWLLSSSKRRGRFEIVRHAKKWWIPIIQVLSFK